MNQKLDQSETKDKAAADSARARAVKSSVEEIIEKIRSRGDQGLDEIIDRFNDVKKPGYKLSEAEVEAAIERVKSGPEDNKTAIETAAGNIEKFARAIMENVKSITLDNDEFSSGVDFVPVERAGCYVPGGKYPLPSTALMTTITASVAGVKEICVATPALCDETIYAGSLYGVKEFYILGGAQAVAAMALGTESVKRVDMIVGPGNAYVTEAKRQLLGEVGIDMLAGPSEIAIIADGKQNAEWIAVDMVSQAEHGDDARACLFTDSQELADSVKEEIDRLLLQLNQTSSYLELGPDQIEISALTSIKACIEKVNELAPEHLEIQIEHCEEQQEELKEKLKNYGTVLFGALSTVPYGDYAAGPNHTLPTNRSARFSGALNPFTFLRAQTWLKVKPGATILPRTTMTLANVEGLRAHARAAEVRLD